MKYYPNSYPIYKQEVCPHSPCHDHNFHLPKQQCVEAVGSPEKENVEFCNVLNAITPKDIIDKVKEIL